MERRERREGRELFERGRQDYGRERKAAEQDRRKTTGRHQRWVPINDQSDRGRSSRDHGRYEGSRGAYKDQGYKPPSIHVFDRVFPRLPSSLPAGKSNHLNGGVASYPKRHEQGNETTRTNKKILFKDLFSEEEEDKRQGWTEVRRRRPRTNKLPPLIKYPCFFCGLPGHQRQSCPKKLRMICYGCHQPGHRLSECPAVDRVKDMTFDFEDVEEIQRIAAHLSKFVLYQPLHGLPTPEELRSALRKTIDKLEWYDWEGSITSMAQGRFLVSFNNEFRANNLVKLGMIDFGNFTGRFHLWSENMGAEKICMPVSVWVDIKGLPLQCWIPDMVKQMVAKFGRFRKMTNNVFDKSTADVIKVLVEVEDISVIPKVMHCSYKALSDDKIRTYAVSIEPKGKSLPMSQIDPHNWELALAASGGTSEVVEDWREEDLVTTARKERAAGDENQGNSDGEGGHDGGIDEGGNKGGNDEGGEIHGGFNEAVSKGVFNVAMEEEEDRVMEAGVREGRDVEGRYGPNSNSNSNWREVNAGGPSNSERAAIAKGKRPMYDGPDLEKLKKRLLRPFSNSGSDSYDPDSNARLECAEPGKWNAVGLVRGGPTGSEDEISATGTVPNLGEAEVLEANQQGDEGDEEGEDEGEGSEEVDSAQVLREAKEKEDDPKGKGKEKRVEGDSFVAETPKVKLKMKPSKKRLPLPQHLGMLKKGGFSFGKRARSSSASSKSASKPGTNQTSRVMPRPIAALNDDFIADVSRNVGLKKPLSKSKIVELKNLERDRASRMTAL